MRWLAFALLVGCGRIGFDATGALAIAPRDVTSNVNSTIAFTAIGGTPPYSFVVDAGLGTIDDAGRFRAGPEVGAAQVSVIDNAGDTDATTVTVGGDLYVVGGSSGGAGQTAVYTSADGVTWQLAGNLPAGRGYGMLYVYDDAMIYAGGQADTAGGTPVYSEIWRTTDGASWTQIGAFPFTLACGAHAVFRGKLWVSGGNGSQAAYGATISTSADGVNWTVEATAPLGLHCGALAVYRDRLWLLAGHAAAGQSAAVFSSDDGLSWTQMTPLPGAGEYHAVGVFDDRLWVAGGLGLGMRVVWTQDGAVWTDAAPFTVARQDAMLTTIGQQLWVIGGVPEDSLWSASGSGWTTRGTLPVRYYGERLARFTPKP